MHHLLPATRDGDLSLIRYADDFVILVRGAREQAEAVRDEAARVFRDELEMELSEEKTFVTRVDEGFDFLGHRIRRDAWRKSKVAFTHPSKRSVEAIKYKVKNLTHAVDDSPEPQNVATSSKLGITRMGNVLPLRCEQANARMRRLFRMVVGLPLAAEETSQANLSVPTKPVLRRALVD
jgi:hypothetical protein